VIERVRAILITPANTMLVIKRTKPGMAPYWVLPGGHADDTDSSLEAALRREIREELAGDATVLRLIDVLHRETERQYFYLDLKPDKIATFITDALHGEGGLFVLPDLRETGRTR
jgi:8-oxo-dGTP pyrophosphatase MutT (NUDIX family)